jgi:hypothetical protein
VWFRESWELLCVTLCDAHTFREGIDVKQNERKIPMKWFIKCLKLYLAYEHWVTEPYSRAQVRHPYKVLGELIKMIKQCFPREVGWGWNLPKMHAFAKMPSNILKFGSANNFLENIGECALKGLLKIMQVKQREDQIDLLNNVPYASTRETFSNML